MEKLYIFTHVDLIPFYFPISAFWHIKYKKLFMSQKDFFIFK